MSRMSRCLALGFWLGLLPATLDAAEDWLTDSERDFFQALGVSATVGGKVLKVPGDFSKLPGIARSANQPLKGRIETIASASEKMKVTPEEKARFAEYMRKGQQEAQRQMGGMLLGALLGQDSFEAARDATNGLMKGANVKEAWELQRVWLERGLNARAEADAALDAITNDLSRRIEKQRDSSDLPLSVTVENRQLTISGKVGTSTISQPVLQLRLFRNTSNGQWTGLNVASGMLAQAMGIDAMNGPAQVEGGRLAAAQERKMNLPMLATVLLPSLEPGNKVSVALGIPASASTGLDRVEARLWSGEGTFEVGILPGLDRARALAAKIAEDARREALARRPMGRTPFGAGAWLPRRSTPRPGTRLQTGAGSGFGPAPVPKIRGNTKPSNPAAPVASRGSTGPTFKACEPGLTLVLAPPPDGGKIHTFETCRPLGSGYPSMGKSIRMEFDSRVPPRAVAENDETFVSVGRDVTTRSTSLVLIPKDRVAQVLDQGKPK